MAPACVGLAIVKVPPPPPPPVLRCTDELPKYESLPLKPVPALVLIAPPAPIITPYDVPAVIENDPNLYPPAPPPPQPLIRCTALPPAPPPATIITSTEDVTGRVAMLLLALLGLLVPALLVAVTVKV